MNSAQDFSAKKQDDGYVLMGVLFLIALGLIAVAGMLDSSASNSKTRALVNTQSQNYYEVEETLNRVVAWLQTNSKNITSAFLAANFENNFDLGSPALGDNEGEYFGVPTMVKMNGGSNSVMLSNNDFFGTPAFPSTNHMDTNAAFDAATEFENADLGEANARVVLIWARQTQGNYEPIFRIDVVTGNNPDRGVHSYSYVYTTLQGGGSPGGFYGKNSLTFNTPNNDCYSYAYAYSGGAWSRGAPRSNCPAASDNMITVSSDIYGTAASLIDPGVTLAPPGGNVSAGVCEGAGCHSIALPSWGSNWSDHCPGGGADLTINANTTLTIAGCYRDVSISNNRTLTLNNVTTPFYFRNIIQNGNNARVGFPNIRATHGTNADGSDKAVTIYLQQWGNNNVNGNQFTNPNNAPHQVVFNYYGTNALTFNGTADINAFVVAPNASVTVSGNFNFYGGIRALSLLINGNARVNYDEAGGLSPGISDMSFALKKASQRYR